MRTILLILVGIAIAATMRAEDATAAKKPAPAAGTAEIYDPTQIEVLRPKKGQKITVEGTIARAGENRAASLRYLNFTQNYRESVSLVFVVSKNAAEFTAEKLNGWVGKKVRATGMLKEYGTNLQMEIEKWAQLQEVP